MNLINLVTLAAALYFFALLFDRLRLINWRTTKPLYMALYVSHTLWVLSIVWFIFDTGVTWGQVFGLVAMGTWLAVTRKNWLDGVPEEATKPGHLGVPELDTYQ